jgi:hypothetical protein
MVTAPISTYSPSDITRSQSRAGEWNASFAFDIAGTATPSYLDVIAPNESLAEVFWLHDRSSSDRSIIVERREPSRESLHDPISRVGASPRLEP